MSKTIPIIKAFAYGGIVGIIGNAILTMMQVIGLNEQIAPLATLLTIGFIGCILFAANKGKRLTESPSSIGFLPFYGLGIAIAQTQWRSRLAGKDFLASFLTSWRSFFAATSIGIAISLVTGFAVAVF